MEEILPFKTIDDGWVTLTDQHPTAIMVLNGKTERGPFGRVAVHTKLGFVLSSLSSNDVISFEH
jgi:hypothetical protein